MKISSFFVVILFLLACKEDVDAPKDAEAPVIAITSPTANQVFSGGQTVAITGTITDNIKVKEVHLEIFNNANGVLLTHEHYVPGGTNYSLSRSLTIPAGASYKIKVEAEDESSNKAQAQLNISAN